MVTCGAPRSHFMSYLKDHLRVFYKKLTTRQAHPCGARRKEWESPSPDRHVNVAFEREKMAKCQHLKEQMMSFRPRKPGTVSMVYGKATMPVITMVKIRFNLAVTQ